MSRARPAYRPVAFGAALLLAMVSVVPVQAKVSRDPVTDSGALAVAPQPEPQAWDNPSADDPGRLIVTFRAGTTAAARTTLTTRAGALRIADVPAARAETLQAPAGSSPATIAATIATLRADPHVARVSVDHRRYREADPTAEPLWDDLWGLDNTGQDLDGEPLTGGTVDADVDGREALGITTGSPAVVVAMIDDGVDFSHPDLAARAWTNPGESGDGKETNGIDDDGNGYVDDVHGWDFCHDDNTVHDPNDDFHGTHVAGTIAASLDGEGVVGVAPNVSIMALKFLGDDPACGFDSQAIAAIAYAKSFGVHIANASWGGPGRPVDAPELHDAIADSGMLFVAAAGNDSLDNDAETEPTLPASFDLPNIISVAAIDNSGGLAWFSDFGAQTVDIAAPGEAILSSVPADTTHAQPYWKWLSGTSMAAPHVTGTAALVASIAPTLAADPVAMKAHLLASGKPDEATEGFTLTGKIVDAYRALDLVPPVAAAPSTFGFVVGSVASATSVSVKVGWPAGSDDRTGVVAYGLQQRTGAGAWLTARGSTPDRSTLRSLRPGTAYGFRVRALDGGGNWSAFATSGLRPALYQETTSGARFFGSWGHWRTGSASGGATRFATRAGATATFRFTGRGFALIAPKGPTRGSARLYVDGVLVSTVNESRAGSQARIVVAARAWSVSGAHTVKLVVLGTAHHPRFDIDAFAVLR